jgi:hypothetical protein
LNIERPELQNPLIKEIQNRFEYLFKISNPLIMKVLLPMSGFVVGQIVPMKISINNPTKTTVEFIKIELIKVNSFSYDFPCMRPGIKTIVDMVKEETYWIESVGNGNKDYYYKNFRIPNVPPSTLGSCKIIEIFL